MSDSIVNLEDLDPELFIDVLERLESMSATEKLDGVTVWFGLSESGKLFTSRPGSTDRKYSETDYPYFASNNTIRAAHAGLEEALPKIQKALAPNDVIEIEVLHGRQPNGISYGLDGKSYIVLVRGVQGTNELKLQALRGELLNAEVKAKYIAVETPNGEDLDRRLMNETFQFVGHQKIDSKVFKGLGIAKKITALRKYLNDDSGIQNLSNKELLATSLTSIPKEERDAARAARDLVQSTVTTKFKLDIKREILAKVHRGTRPSLAAKDLKDEEDLGLEGVFLNDPATGAQIKIVDNSSFKALNAFNYAVKGELVGPIKTVDDDAPLAQRGGIVGELRIRIADLLGNKELAISRIANEFFGDSRGDSPTMTLRNAAKKLHVSNDVNGLKRKILAMIDATLVEIQRMLKGFIAAKDTDGAYKLKTSAGKTLTMNDEAKKRTMLAFAEAKRNVLELRDQIENTQAFEHLVSAVFGKVVKGLHASTPEGLTEQLEPLFEMKPDTNKNLYRDVPDAWTLNSIYLATVMMATVMYKAEDKRGYRFLRDKHNYRLAKYDPQMLPVNFWGYVLWNAKKPAVAKLLRPKVAAEVSRIAAKVPHRWVTLLHLDLSYLHDVPVDWNDHLRTLQYFIQHANNLNTERVNTLLKSAFAYDTLSFDEKVKFLPKLYFYAMQFVPSSPLLTRIRAIQNKLLGTDSDENGMVMALGQKLLGEDGEIAVPAGVPAAPPPSTNAGGISSIETGIGKVTVMRRRNPNAVTRKKFVRPTGENI